MSETVAICLVGLPGAGKTTYLAALWCAARDTPLPGRYSIVDFPANPSYLQRIADSWFEGRQVERNSSGAVEPTSLRVAAEDRTEFVLHIPDLSGEAFRDAVADRVMQEEVAGIIRDSSFVLFFVNAAKASAHVSIADLPPTPVDDTDDPEETVPFNARELETDILNAELIQLIPALRDGKSPPMLVVVSAWDVVDAYGQSPSEWLSTHQPMFAQVLEEYGLTAPVAVMGISAQGADYEVDQTIVEQPPSERPTVLIGTERTTDIGRPLIWFDDVIHEVDDGGQ